MGEKFGKFEIIKKIATGGMAEIFLARQEGIEGFKKLIVIKRILPHLSNDKEFVNMFLDEARMAALLNHPNIVQIYDLGVINDSYFIAMEYVDGVDLSSILRRGREKKSFLKLGWILRIISQVCEGLYYAHTLKDQSGQSLGLIHRDITPENILISFNGNVKITDFGIARARGRSTSTTSGTLKGKFPYMSYEMVRGMEIDYRSDIFSLGIVMWEMLTYRRLFKRETEVASINAILNEEIPSPKRYFKNLPDQVEAIVMKALERDRDKRYQTAREMEDDIDDFITKNRISIKVSEFCDYLRSLFPDKESHQDSEKVSSSRSNSLPVITLQRNMPLSESETVVLTPKPEALKNRPEKVQEVSSEKKISLSNIKPLSQVMAEIQPTEKREEKAGHESKVNVEIDDGAGMAKADSEEAITVVEKKRGRAIYLISGVIGALCLFIAVLFFSLKTGGEKKAISNNKKETGVVKIDSRAEKSNNESMKEDEKPVLNQATSPVVDAKVEKAEDKKEDNVTKIDRQRREKVVSKREVKEAEVERPVITQRGDKGKEESKGEVQVAQVEKRRGFISVDSDPWAEVYIGDKKIGDTPIVRYELFEGSYNLLLKNSQFGFEKSVRVDVKPDENSVHKIKLMKGYLNITSTSPIEVRLGENLLGKTPLMNIDMYEGVYRIILFDPVKKKSKVVRVEIKAGKTTNINEDL